MKRVLGLLIASIVAVVSLTAPTLAVSQPVKNLSCNGSYENVTVKNVTVPVGGYCVLKNVHVTGGVHAKKGANNLYVVDNTVVEHNIQANGVLGWVWIGPENCKVDPPVGNNVHVTNSHNVQICQVTADNNILVTRNDGQITVRNSSAGNNVHVSNNFAFNADDQPVVHRHPEWIRVRDTHADGHIQIRGNDRHVHAWRNTADGGFQCSGDVDSCD